MSMKLILTTSVTSGRNIGKWIILPFGERRLPSMLDILNMRTAPVDYLLTDREASTVFFRGTVSSYLEVLRLNELAKAINSLTDNQEKAFCALMECECSQDVKAAEDIISNQLPKWELVEGIDSDDSLREYLSELYGREVLINEVLRLRKLNIFIFTTYGCLISTRLVRKSVWTIT